MTNTTPPKRPVPPQLAAHAWKKGFAPNPKGRQLERKIDGVPISKFFNDHLGPTAAKVCEKVLLNTLQKNPNEIKPFEVELAKWQVERIYGKAPNELNINANVATHNQYMTTNLSIEDMEKIANSIVIEGQIVEDDDQDNEE